MFLYFLLCCLCWTSLGHCVMSTTGAVLLARCFIGCERVRSVELRYETFACVTFCLWLRLLLTSMFNSHSVHKESPLSFSTKRSKTSSAAGDSRVCLKDCWGRWTGSDLLCFWHRFSHFNLNGSNLRSLLEILQHGPVLSELEYGSCILFYIGAHL